jgi:hypothetical protein
MTPEQLTAIYNKANGLDPKRHNSVTTERIFRAMDSAYRAGQQLMRERADNLFDESSSRLISEAEVSARIRALPLD